MTTKRNYKYFYSLIPGAVVIASNLAGGWWVLSNFVLTFGVFAVVEWFFPENKSNENLSKKKQKQRKQKERKQKQRKQKQRKQKQRKQKQRK